MNRREFIALIGGISAAPLAAARAQQEPTPVIGFLHAGMAAAYANALAGFGHGLKESGYVEGQNARIEYRWAENKPDHLRQLAVDLVNRNVSVIVSGGGAASALAAHAATSSIPIVVIFGSDPVQLGLVSSLNRPGGNVTGVSFLTTLLVKKRVDLLHQLVPSAVTIGYIATPSPLAEQMLQDVTAAAHVLGLEVIVVNITSEREFENAFTTLLDRKVSALMIASEPLLTSGRDILVALAARYRIPTLYPVREFALAGGLISYGASFADAFQLGGRLVGQILKGAKPADLPVEQSSRFELVINLKTAKKLGLTVPQSLLVAADEVIE